MSTKTYPTKELAYIAIKSFEKSGDSIDYSKLDASLKIIATRTLVDYKTKEETVVTETRRDITATISALTEVVKDLIARIEALEAK